MKKEVDDDDDDDDDGYNKPTEGNAEEFGEYFDYYIGVGSWSAHTGSDLGSDTNNRVLNFLESGSVISILEDLHQEIIILKYVIGAPVVRSWDFDYKTLEERFLGSRTPNKIFPEVDSTPALTTPLKLQRDRHFIEKIIEETLKTVLEDGTFEPIIEAARSLTQRHTDERTLIEDVKKNLEYLKDIKERVREKRRMDDLEERQRDELLYKLQDEIDDITLKCSIDEQFVDKWELTRDKQNKKKLQIEEDSYRDQIEKLNKNSELERRVNEEMQTFIKGNQLELEEQLEEWMARYDAELDRRENKILQLKYTRDQTEEEVKRLENLYAARQVEMKEWIKFRELRKRRTLASLVIQSWWRAFMVRKKLGPYKEKKGKGKKK